MRIGDFDFYRDYLKKRAGIALTSDKSYLLVSHLTPVSKKWGYPTLEAMTLAMRGMPNAKMAREVVEVMMTGETAFFRDPDMFRHLSQTVVPHLLKNRKKKNRLRIWSAGCATGAEAWSIAITLREMTPAPIADILATDFSESFLQIAQDGQYAQFELQRGMPMPLLVKYFEPLTDGAWKTQPVLQDMVTFMSFNLVDKMSRIGTFDIIFCCNLLNTFDADTKQQVLSGLTSCLVPDGVLVLGAGETVESHDSLELFAGIPGFHSLKK